jgi:hypothetical protein
MGKLVPNWIKNNTKEEIDVPFLDFLFHANKMLKEAHKPYSHWYIIIDDQISEDVLKD